MDDDWDGVDWAEHFSGPDDDEIERRHAQVLGEDLEVEPQDFSLEMPIQSEIQVPEVMDSGYLYTSFEVASNRANERNSLSINKYRVEAVDGGWVLKSTPVSDLDRIVEDYCDTESKFSMGIALFYALSDFQEDYANQLLERPLEVNVVGVTGSSPLMVAAQRGYSNICSKLLDLGAKFKTKIETSREDTVMERALRSGDWATIEVITKVYLPAEWSWMKVNMSASDLPYWGYPRLVEAARYGMSALCAEMIGHGVDANYGKADFQDESPIEAAFSNNQISTCIVLAAMGANVQPLRVLDEWNNELESTFSIITKHYARGNAIQ